MVKTDKDAIAKLSFVVVLIATNILVYNLGYNVGEAITEDYASWCYNQADLVKELQAENIYLRKELYEAYSALWSYRMMFWAFSNYPTWEEYVAEYESKHFTTGEFYIPPWDFQCAVDHFVLGNKSVVSIMPYDVWYFALQNCSEVERLLWKEKLGLDNVTDQDYVRRIRGEKG